MPLLLRAARGTRDQAPWRPRSEPALSIVYDDDGAQNRLHDWNDGDCPGELSPRWVDRTGCALLGNWADGCSERRRLCHRARDERGLSGGSLSQRISIRRSLRLAAPSYPSSI